jgi:hypothetical protein
MSPTQFVNNELPISPCPSDKDPIAWAFSRGRRYPELAVSSLGCLHEDPPWAFDRYEGCYYFSPYKDEGSLEVNMDRVELSSGDHS